MSRVRSSSVVGLVGAPVRKAPSQGPQPVGGLRLVAARFGRVHGIGAHEGLGHVQYAAVRRGRVVEVVPRQRLRLLLWLWRLARSTLMGCFRAELAV